MNPEHRFLVLGACGNVGQWVVHELATRFPASTVLASVRPGGISRPAEHWKALANVRPVEVDLDDIASVAAAMKGVDRVYVIPQNTPRQLDHDRNAMNAAREIDSIDFYVKQSVCRGLSSSDSNCIFLAMHAQAEAELAESGLRYAILRPNFAMMNVFFMVLPSLPYGAVQWPFPTDLELALVDARDAGAVGAVLLGSSDPDQHHGKDVHVLGPDRWTPPEIVSEVGAKCGRADAQYVQVSEDAFRKTLVHGADMTEQMADAVTEIFRDTERGCRDGTMYVDDTGPDGAIPFETSVGRQKYGFREFLEFFSVRDAYHRMQQHSAQNPSY